jgi:outer membrane protein OmpA-like peptidoglycan-associated protein
MNQSIVKSVLSCMICGLLALSMVGCRSDDALDGTDYDGDDLIDMTDGDDLIGLEPRGDLGRPVTDVTFETVAFLYDSYQIADSERGKIESVSDYLNSNSDVTAVIDGHCDERGSREYNLSLGEHRALAVRAYMITLGVSGDRVHTRSFGEEQPIVAGHGESIWRQNRRGEFSLYRQ